MTFPTGPVPYGQGHGYGQPPGYPAPRRPGNGVAFYLNLGVVALGIISFFLGFAPYSKSSLNVDLTNVDKSNFDMSHVSRSVSFFQNAGSGVGVAGLGLLVAAALIALLGVIRKKQSADAVVAGLSVAGFVSLLFLLIGLGTSSPVEVPGVKISVDAGVGLILVLVASFLQSAIAIGAYVLSSGMVNANNRPPQYGDYAGPQGYGQPGYGPQQFAGQPTQVIPGQATHVEGTTYQPPYPPQ